MSKDVNFQLDPHPVTGGTPEEDATTGFLSLHANGRSLTRLFNAAEGKERPGPLVPAIHLAEWLLENWWRLRYEPLRDTYDWQCAHRLTEIGEGYVWPVITIRCANDRAILRSWPSGARGDVVTRYFGLDAVELIPASSFEAATDAFVERVAALLDEAGIADSDLHRLMADLADERADADLRALRILEAHLGLNPDEADETQLRVALRHRDRLGADALNEVAAHCGDETSRTLRETLKDIETAVAQDWRPGDALALAAPVATLSPASRGVMMAREARCAIGNDDGCLTDDQLAGALGISASILSNEHGPKGRGIGFGWRDGGAGHFHLQSNRGTGKRFETARILGDYLMVHDPLCPATSSRTTRQAAQKAFAAELLSPIDAVRAHLNGDLSQDAQDTVADHFAVSPKTIEMLLKNNGDIPRTEADAEELLGMSEPVAVAA